MSWEDSTLTLDDFKEAYEKIRESVELREKYEAEVEAYIRFLPLCPLIKYYYGSNRAAFELPPKPTPLLELKIEPPKREILSHPFLGPIVDVKLPPTTT